MRQLLRKTVLRYTRSEGKSCEDRIYIVRLLYDTHAGKFIVKDSWGPYTQSHSDIGLGTNEKTLDYIMSAISNEEFLVDKVVKIGYAALGCAVDKDRLRRLIGCSVRDIPGTSGCRQFDVSPYTTQFGESVTYSEALRILKEIGGAK